jgi:hypothetical protein
MPFSQQRGRGILGYIDKRIVAAAVGANGSAIAPSTSIIENARRAGAPNGTDHVIVSDATFSASSGAEGSGGHLNAIMDIAASAIPDPKVNPGRNRT